MVEAAGWVFWSGKFASKEMVLSQMHMYQLVSFTPLFIYFFGAREILGDLTLPVSSAFSMT